MRDDAVIQRRYFSDINLDDPFFNSLKSDYSGFENWFIKKAQEQAWAFVTHGDGGNLEGFLYLKVEKGPVADTTPPINIRGNVLKIGTFKINAHGTKLGERFIKKVFDCAIAWEISNIYVTVFSKHAPLITLLSRYGFTLYGKKESVAGTENVYYKDFITLTDDSTHNYPIINAKKNTWLLSVFPKYHTGLFPDSRLNTEEPNIVEDVDFTNSIHKVYVGRAYDIQHIQSGDTIVTYRTAEPGRSAHYSAVATSLCTVIETRSRSSFEGDKKAFLDYCLRHSVFNEEDLLYWYNRADGPELYAIKMTYNVALPKRITRAALIEDVGLNASDRWTLLKLTDEQLKLICTLGKVYEGVIVY